MSHHLRGCTFRCSLLDKLTCRTRTTASFASVLLFFVSHEQCIVSVTLCHAGVVSAPSLGISLVPCKREVFRLLEHAVRHLRCLRQLCAPSHQPSERRLTRLSLL